ncbi:hypothetical protein [Coleofasciculus sp.]|uniref:hypothetical protein n=1 Tax=Coleofasciculus sp. TaxID=3100458 RepID=UPI003A4B6D6F
MLILCGGSPLRFLSYKRRLGARYRYITCDYVGQTPWAKGYGTFPTYHVRRRHV